MGKIPFRAALFDLDGTLLDSMYVWLRIDEIFFGKRGMAVPEDYSRKVAGMSHRETAEFTVANYLPDDTWQGLVKEWSELSAIEYAERVPLKKGAKEYLRMLRREGVKLAVTTALPPHLFEPCLRRLGIMELFDEQCSTEHTGGRGKGDGEVYLLAARKLGVEPSECAVFEDVLAGISGAKKVGMRAYCVRDDHSKKDFAAMEALADGTVDTLDQMIRYHDFPESPRCVVFSAYCEGDSKEIYRPERGDFVLCADAGWKIAAECGAKAAKVIGDFDTAEAPSSENVERYPAEKDDSDTALCLKYGMKQGYERFLIVGGFGGRFDHAVANVQMMRYAAERDVRVEMRDGRHWATVVRNGSVTMPKAAGKLSVFALSDRCEGVSIRGAKYALDGASLKNDFPLGLSNEFASDAATVAVREGALLIVISSVEE